jgi:hypothetical protein
LQGLLPLVPIVSEHKELEGLLEYELNFYQAFATFQHQVVFDPRTRQVACSSLHAHCSSIVFMAPSWVICVLQTVHRKDLELSQLPSFLFQAYGAVSGQGKELQFLGTRLEPSLACAIADGLVCPVSKVARKIKHVVNMLELNGCLLTGAIPARGYRSKPCTSRQRQ